MVVESDIPFARQLRDPMGRTITLNKPPIAIVSNILAGDEMLSRLVDSSRVQGVTYLVDDPGISNVAGFYPKSVKRQFGSVEETIAAEPDLVIVAGYSDATQVDMLLNTDIPILRFANFNQYDDIRQNLRTLARVVGAEEKAEVWLLEMDQRIEEIQRRVAQFDKPRVLYYSLTGWTAGPGSIMDETITLAGGQNVISETGLGASTRITPEMAIALQPDVVLVSDWGEKGGKSAKQLLSENPAWQDVPAIINKRIYSLSGAWLTSGSPFLVNGVESVAYLLHPSAFDAHTLREQTL